MNMSMTIGLIFCHVANKRQDDQGSLDITWGSHWWYGAAPIFKHILIIKANLIILSFSVVFGLVAVIPAVSMSPLPTAWIIKYLTLAIVSWSFWEWAIIGTKDKRFSSIPIHKYSQFDLDKLINVPDIIEEENKKNDGVIKSWKELNLSGIKLEAFIYAVTTYFHSREPSFHSWYKPVTRIVQIIITAIFVLRGIISIDGTGIKRAISMSNTRKITAKIKNWRENGIRAELCGSNPHSNGVGFSGFKGDFFLRIIVAMIITMGNTIDIKTARNIDIIFLGDEFPIDKVKICCCCKLLRKMLEGVPHD